MNLTFKLKTKIGGKYYRRLKTVSELALPMGLKPFLVGGIVRDIMLSSKYRMIQQDCDVTVTGGDVSRLAGAFSEKWKAKLVSYPQFLTFTVQFNDGTHMDLVTARREKYEAPASLPAVEAGDLKSDLFRRDFTVNAMALSLNDENFGEVIDLFNGSSDLKKKFIRILHPKSFADDPTRIFRAARFAGRFGFSLEKETKNLLERSVQNRDIEKLSKDRIRTELEKIFQEKKVSPILEKLFQWGVFDQIHSKLKWSQAIRKRMEYFDERVREKKSRNDAPNLAIDSSLRCHSGLDPESSFSQLRSLSDDAFIANRLTLWLMDDFFSERMRRNDKIEGVESDAEQILSKLHFPKSVTDAVIFNLNLCSLFKTRTAVTFRERVKIADGTALFFDLLVKMAEFRRLKKQWNDYQKWCRVKPILDGTALAEMGYRPGPIFKKILEELALEKFKGKCKSRREEMRFVVDNYRRD